MNLSQFLEHKSLYYDKIDYDTIKRGWSELESFVKLPFVIHIVGTNGKGTTGRFLAHYLTKIGKNTVHYSSPHITHFNERIWINGKDSTDEQLELAHKNLQTILSSELLAKLTYFEYTTLLSILIASRFDYLVFEAGLGGEFDATSVVSRELSLITTIDIDHQAFLGDTVEAIAATKLRCCKNDLILGYQIHNEVYEIAKQLFDEKKILRFDENLQIPHFLDYPEYLKNNLRLSCAALKYLGFDIDFENFKNTPIKGRFEKIASNITIDVGHNPLAAMQIKKALDETKINLIYGSYKDKDYRKVLEILKDNIEEVLAIEITDDSRIEKFEVIIECANSLGIKASKFEKIEENKQYLVFGSFKVVEKFISIF